MVGSLAENVRRSCWDEWADATCPTLTVLGRSGIITPQEADGMFRPRPHTVDVSIPGTGHDVRPEQPDVLRQVLKGFLSEVLAAAPAQSARVERA